MFESPEAPFDLPGPIVVLPIPAACAGMHLLPDRRSVTGVWLGAVGDGSTPIPDSDSVSYTVTANSFMMGGGDGYTVLESADNLVQTADSDLPPPLA